ncbi:hypothetical protein pipiens_006750 [Culex pipiens pipiens]|uniref:Uncharacterized protein n=1 Tax=Culex pipiens pipiens TaxID=38569 RepID=A0ABD1DNC8_CULPP
MFCCSTTKRLEICTPEATIQVCFPLIRVAIRSANPPPYDNRPKPVIRLPICVDIRRSTCLAPNWADNLVIFYRGVRICVDKFREARHDQPLRADLREQQRSSGDLLVNKIRLLVNKIRLLVNKIWLLIRAVLLTGRVDLSGCSSGRSCSRGPNPTSGCWSGRICLRGVRTCVDKETRFREARHDQPLRADLRDQQRSSGDLLVNKIRLLAPAGQQDLAAHPGGLAHGACGPVRSSDDPLARPKSNIRLLVRADLLTRRADLRRQGDPARRRKEFSAILSSVAINALGISNEPKMSPVDDLPRTGLARRKESTGMELAIIFRCAGRRKEFSAILSSVAINALGISNEPKMSPVDDLPRTGLARRKESTGMELAIIVPSVRSGDEE